MKLSKMVFNETSFELKQVEVTNVTAQWSKKVANLYSFKVAKINPYIPKQQT